MMSAVPESPRIPVWLATGLVVAFGGFLVWTSWQADEMTDRLSPDHAPMHYYLGDYQLRTGQLEHAVASFERAVANEPTSFAAHAGLGTALVRLGQSDRAVSSFERALALEPHHAESHCNLGNILLRRGDLEEACAHYRQTLEAEPDEISALNNLAWVLATSSDATLRDGAQAIQFAEHARQVTKVDHPMILMTLAAAYAEAGRFADAITTAELAAKLAEEASNVALVGTLSSHLQSYRRETPIRVAAP